MGAADRQNGTIGLLVDRKVAIHQAQPGVFIDRPAVFLSPTPTPVCAQARFTAAPKKDKMALAVVCSADIQSIADQMLDRGNAGYVCGSFVFAGGRSGSGHDR